MASTAMAMTAITTTTDITITTGITTTTAITTAETATTAITATVTTAIGRRSSVQITSADGAARRGPVALLVL
jgi:hypothetical protein